MAKNYNLETSLSRAKKYFEEKGLYVMQKEDIKTFAKCAVSAYKNDPIYEETLSGDKEGNAILFWEIVLSVIIPRTIVVADKKDCDVFAIVEPPEFEKITFLQFISKGLYKIARILSRNIFSVLKKYNKISNEKRKIYKQEGYWAIERICVKGQQQRQGLSHKVLDVVLDYFDESGKKCYVNVTKIETVAIFEQYDFKIEETIKIPELDTSIFIMTY